MPYSEDMNLSTAHGLSLKTQNNEPKINEPKNLSNNLSNYPNDIASIHEKLNILAAQNKLFHEQNKLLLDKLETRDHNIKNLQSTISFLNEESLRFQNEIRERNEKQDRAVEAAERRKQNKKKKKKTITRDVIIMEDVKKILELSKSENKFNKFELRLAVVLLFLLGVRITELQQLTWFTIMKYVNGEEIGIKLSKTTNPITQPYHMSEGMRSQFDILIGEEFYLEIKKKNTNSLAFPGSREHFNRKMNGLLKLLKGKNVLSHSCRISFISRIAEVADVATAQQMVGHKNIATTQRYNRYRIDLKTQLEILDKAMEASLKPVPSNRRGRPSKNKEMFSKDMFAKE